MTTTTFSIFEEIVDKLNPLVQQLIEAATDEKKLLLLEQRNSVQDFLQRNPSLAEKMHTLSLQNRHLIYSVIAIGQGEQIFTGFDPEHTSSFTHLLKILHDVESFYDTIGGIVGYHLMVLKLLLKQGQTQNESVRVNYLQPEGIDFTKEPEQVNAAVRWGLENLNQLAEIYPVGGAGDRLQLICNVEQEPLPTAQLLLGGRTLLEGLIRDVQAREFLYYKLFGKQLTIPIALMTSHEKRNHQRITKLFEKNHWFGRSKESFRFFTQPLVPVVDEEGGWVVKKALTPMLKPGGHGVIWKLALDNGIFDWLELSGRSKVLVRQINNPVSGTDFGLLAFTGIGFNEDKAFGFSSCPRRSHAAEGTDVLVETRDGGEYGYTLSNIEYTDFKVKGIDDNPVSPNSPYSAFPANTNILFADLKEMRNQARHCPIPGMIINMKNIVETKDAKGQLKKILAGRLESTMQNISDQIVDYFPETLPEGGRDQLRSYITFNERRKTLSVAKNAYAHGKSFLGTPEGCLYEMMQNMRDLLGNYCKMQLPALESEEEYLADGPSVFALIHPALGPLYQIISQKISGGTIAHGADLILEIAELEMQNINLVGSLHIEAEKALGQENDEGIIRYNELSGKCTLKNVVVRNRGIDILATDNAFWRNHLNRHEYCHIHLSGCGEFYAENVTLDGSLKLFVPDHHRMVAYEENGKTCFKMHSIDEPTWWWDYAFDDENAIVLKKK